MQAAADRSILLKSKPCVSRTVNDVVPLLLSTVYFVAIKPPPIIKLSGVDTALSLVKPVIDNLASVEPPKIFTPNEKLGILLPVLPVSERSKVPLVNTILYSVYRQI